MYYRGVYMVNECMNRAFGILLIPCLKLIVLLGFIVSSYAIIRFRGILDAFSLVLIPASMIASAILIVPIALVMSSTYESSQKFRSIVSASFLQLEVGGIKKQYFERLVKTCALVSCKIGNMYYMEAQAKLTMLDLTVNGLVFLLVNY